MGAIIRMGDEFVRQEITTYLYTLGCLRRLELNGDRAVTIERNELVVQSFRLRHELPYRGAQQQAYH